MNYKGLQKRAIKTEKNEKGKFKKKKRFGKSIAKKAMVVILYSLGRGIYNMLGKIFGVSRTTTYNWIVEVANNLDEIEICDMVSEIEFDEIWHYIGAKKQIVGYQSN